MGTLLRRETLNARSGSAPPGLGDSSLGTVRQAVLGSWAAKQREIGVSPTRFTAVTSGAAATSQHKCAGRCARCHGAGLCTENFGKGGLCGGYLLQYTHPGPQEPLQLREEEGQDPALQTPGFTHQSKFAARAIWPVSWPRYVSNVFSVNLFIFLFLKTGGRGSVVPRASLLNLSSLFLRKKLPGGVPGTPGLFSSAPLGPFPRRRGPTEAGQQMAPIWGCWSPFCREDTRNSPVPQCLGVRAQRNCRGCDTALLTAS